MRVNKLLRQYDCINYPKLNKFKKINSVVLTWRVEWIWSADKKYWLSDDFPIIMTPKELIAYLHS
jgi:hypothetical protein